ncbi:copper resistance CopC family protein [Protaetiibacter larvae]|uniref:Copper resistance protein CopC n=1 Tax=Protaetiibacter larvae TaxID=2592654 RepID=A0A5C1Y7R4_9MICO|nr:copper resistance CopC family protein [Protaetiibacter larvae]QEO09710.1 copper resistance protein CopC [Protaetiibacter larvae]
MTRRLRTAALVAAVAAASLAAALVAAPPAFAHSVLVDSTPADGETLAELPAEFSVTMNEPLLAGAGDAAFALRIRGTDGRYYGDGCVTIVDATMSTPAAIGAAGDYVLEWQVVSEDGHPVGGEVPFRWTGAATGTGTSTPPGCGAPPAEAESPTEPEFAFPLTDILWLVGALALAAVSVGIAVLATRRRPRA